MRIGVSFLLLLFFLVACQSDKLLMDNIASLSLEVEQNAIVNVGSTFPYSIRATLNTGDERKVKNDAFVSFPDGTLRDAGNHRATLIQPLNDFTTAVVPFNLAFQFGDYRVISSDSLHLNFKGPIVADWQGVDGLNGTQPRASASTIFGRDGLEGKPGGIGQNGGNGPHFTGYLWLENDELRLLLICDSANKSYCYRSLQKDSLIINLRGGNAGNGGNGGRGGDGKAGKVDKLPGNGGDGGAGRNGGSLMLFIHPTASYMNESIRLINLGGKGGIGGKGDAPGAPGKTTNGKVLVTSGTAGDQGISEKDGENGPPVTISIVAFDSKSLEHQRIGK